MTPAARVQAAIEILDQVIEAARREGAPADRLISGYFKQRRYAGSKDRRAVRELVYSAIRQCGEVPASGRAAILALAQTDPALVDLFDGSTHGPLPVSDGEGIADRGIAPKWLIEVLAASGADAEVQGAMLGRAPLDVRVNALKADRASGRDSDHVSGHAAESGRAGEGRTPGNPRAPAHRREPKAVGASA